ncbi:MAG: sugar transferase [Chloroflexota bacterium]
MSLDGDKGFTGKASETNIQTAWPYKPSRFSRLSKAALDYVIILPAMVFFSPIFVLIALVIKTTSTGPIFSRHRYLSKHGREFELLSFRTVYLENGEETAVFTPVGRLLYQYRLDVVPQFLHVLIRDISLVGPAPLTPEELGQCHHCGNTILCVLPGLTGLWQLKSDQTAAFSERSEADLAYITRYSLWQDVKILLSTIPAALQ